METPVPIRLRKLRIVWLGLYLAGRPAGSTRYRRYSTSPMGEMSTFLVKRSKLASADCMAARVNDILHRGHRKNQKKEMPESGGVNGIMRS